MMDDQHPAYLENRYNLEIMPGRDYFIRENHWLPRKLGIRLIAFGKTLYCAGDLPVIPDHEFLHIVQFRRFGVPRVIGHYLFHLTRNYLTSFDFAQAYRNIPFEREARYYDQLQQEKNSQPR